MRLASKAPQLVKKPALKNDEFLSKLSPADLKSELKKINKTINDLKTSILNASKFSPNLAVKLGELSYEKHITNKLNNGVCDIKSIPNTNIIHKNFNLSNTKKIDGNFMMAKNDIKKISAGKISTAKFSAGLLLKNTNSAKNLLAGKILGDNFKKGKFLAQKSEILPNENFNLVKVKNNLIKLPKYLTNPYQLTLFKDRIEPPQELHPEVKNIFLSLKRYYDGKKWIKPTLNFSDLDSLREKCIKKGLNWPDLRTRDLTLQPGIKITPTENIIRCGSNSNIYREYIQKNRDIQAEIARTHRKIRDLLRDIPYKFIFPIVKRMGYTHKLIKYSKKIPQIKDMVNNLISDPKFGRADKLQMLYTKLKRLQIHRNNIYNCKNKRNILLGNLVSLDQKRQNLLELCRKNNISLPLEDQKPLIRSAMARYLWKTIRFRMEHPKKIKPDYTKKKYRFKEKRYKFCYSNLKKFSKLIPKSEQHPDKLKKLLTTSYRYNEMKNKYLGIKLLKRDKTSRHFKRLKIRKIAKRLRKERRIKRNLNQEKRMQRLVDKWEFEKEQKKSEYKKTFHN